MTRSTVNALKSAAWSALFFFVGTFGLALLGWLNDVGRWASDHGRTPFPDISVLGYATVAAAVSAAGFVVNLAVRLAQAKGALPGEPPDYLRPGEHPAPNNGGTWALVRDDEDGQAGLATVAWVLVIVLLIVVIAQRL